MNGKHRKPRPRSKDTEPSRTDRKAPDVLIIADATKQTSVSRPSNHRRTATTFTADETLALSLHHRRRPHHTMTTLPTPEQPAKEVFDMKVDELRGEYLLASGRPACDALRTKKPQLKAEILLFRAGVPEHLHGQLREKVVHLNSLRVDHLRAQAFQKLIPGTLTRQETVERMIQKMQEKIEGKAGRRRTGSDRAMLTRHRMQAEVTTAQRKTNKP